MPRNKKSGSGSLGFASLELDNVTERATELNEKREIEGKHEKQVNPSSDGEAWAGGNPSAEPAVAADSPDTEAKAGSPPADESGYDWPSNGDQPQECPAAEEPASESPDNIDAPVPEEEAGYDCPPELGSESAEAACGDPGTEEDVSEDRTFVEPAAAEEPAAPADTEPGEQASIYTSLPVKLRVGRRPGPTAVFYAHRSMLEPSPALHRQLRGAGNGPVSGFGVGYYGGGEHSTNINIGAITLPDIDPPAMHTILAYLYDRHKARDAAGSAGWKGAAAGAAGASAAADAGAFRKRVQLYVHARLLGLDGLARAVRRGLSPSDDAAWPAVLDVGQWMEKTAPLDDEWLSGFLASCVEHAVALDRSRLVSDAVLSIFDGGGPFAVKLYRMLAGKVVGGA